MKIAFRGGDNKFTRDLLPRIQSKLKQHEVVFWNLNKPAPALDIEIILLVGALDRQSMENQPKLVLIQTVGTGYEEIDIDAATELGIWVSYAPSGLTGNASSVAEFAVLLLLAVSRSLKTVLNGMRDKSIEVPSISLALRGKTVCIVGLGSIGSIVAELLRPFSVTLIATEHSRHSPPKDIKIFSADDIKTAVADADYVVICVRASKENENLIDASVLNSMKRGSVLVNIARGSLIDEEALYSAITSGQIAAAGLDVLKTPPNEFGNRLLDLPQVLATPHLAGATDIMLDGTLNYIFEIIGSLSSGKKSKSFINSPAEPRLRLSEINKLSQAIPETAGDALKGGNRL